MNKIATICLLLLSVAAFGQSNSDSLSKQNSAKIQALKARITVLEGATAPSRADYAKEVSRLKKELKVKSDTIAALRRRMKTMVAKKKEAPKPNPQDLSQEQDCNCNRIFFGTGKVYHNYAKNKGLDSIASLAKSKQKYSILITGHTDKTGPESVNMRISKQRAESVKQYLVKNKGLNPDYIKTEWYGSKYPLKYTTKQALNRRAEVFLSY